MSTGMQHILLAVLIVLGILVCFALLYAVTGRRITDKIVAVNMIGTLGIQMIVILSLVLDADYILDVALVFALLSFLTVIVFCRYAQNRAVYDRMQKKADTHAGRYAENTVASEASEGNLQAQKTGTAGEEVRP